MSKLGKVLMLVCLLDLGITLALVTMGIAVEANPLLNYYLEKWGSAGLVISKMWFVLIPIFVLEAGPRVCPSARIHIVRYYNFVIWAYMTLFVSGNLIQFM
ncbi:MAG: hypothetical protein COV96_01400 [Candidatus Zambryskibacteria bacterium CG11_big_fil_rev_8_21_14_0_20_42_18]|uniref:DUF5658 domain-containing protein n=1 Tax=Candidatus Zambryskibacteria bacterium CG_4_9_14_3_um_filter_42_15 TaxID=1975112 RepID=A0A2M7WRU6_9BACT|nr:MAG: hypothetical protein COV96_01400 [Candidatus Zambryskibacteria bacterium CG11_big_fil_rev_8_21_14_0_20_42_18]PJA32739.1 MAG: hypothetical protein CO185_01980 [Candidatus Zambryskibacteria bacterium CG_4_9_14_3_um_filter_42_15]